MERTKRLLRPADLSAAMGVTTARVYQLLNREVDPISHVRIGRSIYIRVEEWEAWLASREKPGPGQARERPRDRDGSSRQDKV